MLTTEQRAHVLALLATMTDAQVMVLSVALDTLEPPLSDEDRFIGALHAVVADHVVDPDDAA